jgi:hypothetical protein
MLTRCIDGVTASLHAQLPELGRNIAIDGSDMPANGQRFVSKGGRERAGSEFSDQDASWDHRSAVSTRKGGGFYGYKLDMAVCTATDLPPAWGVRTARDSDDPRQARPRAQSSASRFARGLAAAEAQELLREGLPRLMPSGGLLGRVSRPLFP